eukprot:3704865-Lingulodinium_polyedra.AAC.1
MKPETPGERSQFQGLREEGVVLVRGSGVGSGHSARGGQAGERGLGQGARRTPAFVNCKYALFRTLASNLSRCRRAGLQTLAIASVWAVLSCVA